MEQFTKYAYWAVDCVAIVLLRVTSELRSHHSIVQGSVKATEETV